MKKNLLASAIALCCLSFSAHADTNLILNPGFEGGNTSWRFYTGLESISTTDKHSGVNAALEPSGQKVEYRQTINNLVPGKNYIVSAWLKVSGSTGTDWGGMRMSINAVVDSKWVKTLSTPYYNTVGDWQKVEIRFTAESATYILQAREQSGANRDVTGYWDDFELKEEVPSGHASNPTYNGNHAMLFRHEYLANDHIEAWMKALASLGVEYDFWFDTYSNTNPNQGPVPTVNRLDGATNPLLDANGKAINSILIHGGGSGNGSGNSATLSAAMSSNVRSFVKGGGNYFGSCMGLWDAAAGWAYGGTPNASGIGLLGQKMDGSVGDHHKFAVRGYQFSASVKGGYQLNPNHVINRNLNYSTVANIKYAGSGYFETELPGWWTAADWNSNMDVIAYNANYPATWGTDTNFGATVNGKPTAVEYKRPDPNFGRVLGSLTHPEHISSAGPYLNEMLKYALFGDSKTDPSGNHKPSGEFQTDKLMYTGNAVLQLSAVNVADVDGHTVQAMWSADQKVLSHNANNGRALTWNASAGASSAYSASISLPASADKPYRLLMRLKDNGSPPRITEKTRLVAVNLADADATALAFDFNANTITGSAPLSVDFSITNVRGDARFGTQDVYLDFGDGAYFSNYSLSWDTPSSVSRNNVYLVPGKYTASAAVKDNDGVWTVKTINIDVN